MTPWRRSIQARFSVPALTVVVILLLFVWSGSPSRDSPTNARATPDSSPVLASIPVGSGPLSIAVDDANGLIYVANQQSENVSVINGTSNAIIGSIPIGNCPTGIAWDAVNNDLFVSGSCTPNVTVIDGATNTVLGNVSAGAPSGGVTVDSSNDQIFVAAALYCTFCSPTEGYLSVINGTTDAMVGRVAVDSQPSEAVAFDPANGDVYAGQAGTGNVSVVNGKTDTLVGNVTTNDRKEPDIARGAAYDASTNAVYVTLEGAGVLAVIDGGTNGVSQWIPVGSDPWGVAIDDWNGDIFVTSGTSNVTAFVGSTPSARIPVGLDPWEISFDDRNGDFYVADYGSDNVTVVDGGLVTPVAPATVSYPLLGGLLGTGIVLALIAGVVFVARRGRRVVAPP